MKKERKLIYVIILNLLILITQIIFGLIAHSLALITDALHNLEDVGSLILSYIAIRVSKREPTKIMTFGYKRAEVIAAIINSSFLIVTLLFIIYKAIERIIAGSKVNSLFVIYVGLFAFIFNSLSVLLLRDGHLRHTHEHENDLNIRAATLHLLSDAGISLGVVLGGVIMFIFNTSWIDPLISILFSIYIIWEGVKVLKKAYRIIMEGVPEETNIDYIIDKLKREVPEILEVHDLHVWSLSSEDRFLSAHIVLKEKNSLVYVEKTIETIRKVLKGMGFNHITIQPETEKYRTGEVYCSPH